MLSKSSFHLIQLLIASFLFSFHGRSRVKLISRRHAQPPELTLGKFALKNGKLLSICFCESVWLLTSISRPMAPLSHWNLVRSVSLYLCMNMFLSDSFFYPAIFQICLNLFAVLTLSWLGSQVFLYEFYDLMFLELGRVFSCAFCYFFGVFNSFVGLGPDFISINSISICEAGLFKQNIAQAGFSKKKKKPEGK